MNAQPLAIHSDQASAPVPVNESAALLTAISSAATNPQFNGENMDRLLSVYERIESRKAEAAYADAFASMQIELPAIAERGKAKVNGDIRYTFALWEDINTAIKPVLARNGFALSFRTDFVEGIAVTGVLQHRSGHREETTIRLPADKSGSKNDVQAVASAVSYGKRYTAGALLNLTSHGEDDDAYTAAETADEQEAREKAESWIAKAEAIQSPAEFNPLRAAVLKDYGDNINLVPPSVRAALADAKAAVTPKD